MFRYIDVISAISGRQALRHVLDASWAGMLRVPVLSARGRQHPRQHHHGDDPVYMAFVATIPPYSSLSRKQRAAVCAIKGSLSSDPGKSRGTGASEMEYSGVV